MTTYRTPKQLIELYWTEVWNNRNAEMIRELCADPIIRHDPGSVTLLSLEDQIARVRQQSEQAEPFFEHEILHADDTYVTSVWNMHTRKGQRVDLCGIEVFKAENGKFTHCWNSSYVAGRWGREGDKAVADNLPPPGLIANKEAITPAWLQSIFQHAGLDAPRISMVSSEPIGHGNLSATWRSRITYNANAEKAVQSVICKLTSGIAVAVDIAHGANAYSREVEVYQVLGVEPPLNAPRTFFAKAGTDGRALNLVLQDLSGQTRSGDQITGCSKDEARAVIVQFAKLHRAFWNDTKLAGASWLYDRASLADATQDNFVAGAAVFRQRFAGRLEARYLDALDRCAPHVASWTRGHTPRRTLIHGEARVDNILFEDKPSGVEAWLIDWQFSDLGSPMFDTAYFLAGSLTTEDRRACERELIGLHQASLAEVAPDFSLDLALEEYADALAFALYTTVGAALAIPPGEHADKLLMTLLKRNIDALSDWGRIP